MFSLPVRKSSQRISPLLVLIALVPIGFISRPASAMSSDDMATAIAQLQSQFNSQQAKLTSQDSQINKLTATVESQSETIAQLRAAKQVSPRNGTYGPFTVTGTDVYLTGYNLHIQSGAGTTNATPNGLGNLIVGYNATRGGSGDRRTGSHNIILGDQQNYFGYGGFACGVTNTLKGAYSCIFGGQYNSAIGDQSVVVGGFENSATNVDSVIEGGANLTTAVQNDLQPYNSSVPGLKDIGS